MAPSNPADPARTGVAPPLVLRALGSFFIGGRIVTASGSFDPTLSVTPSSAGQSFWVDQMYVQYQIPEPPTRIALILVHGGGGTGAVWETTADGREGYQTIFLRRGHPVYIVDAPRGGRSGFPSFTGPLGVLDETTRIAPDRTHRPGHEYASSRWRLEPDAPDQAFPSDAADAFFKHVRPLVSDDPEVVSAALLALLDRIGPAVLVTHSNAGLWGWLAAARSSYVRAVVSYEPGVVFPSDAMPAPIPLFRGEQAAGTPMSAEEFSRLATVPLQIVYGDNIPRSPTPNLIADSRRAQVEASSLFVAALNAIGGRARLLHLRDAGLRGNSHFMFSDLNNIHVAAQLSLFLEQNGLGERSES